MQYASISFQSNYCNCIGPVVDYIVAHVLAMTEVATRAGKFT